MKRHYKYLSKRKKKHGYSWVISPSRAIKKALGVGFEQYNTHEEARKRSIDLEEAFDHWKRTQKPIKKLHIEDDTVDALFSFYTSRDAYKKLSDNSK